MGEEESFFGEKGHPAHQWDGTGGASATANNLFPDAEEP